jgi:L-fuconolactonase
MATETKYTGGATGGMVVRPDWLARHQEAIIDGALPVVDAHHHIWDPPGARYLLDELLSDVKSGHKVDATVFMECHSMYRTSGPEDMQVVGETEYMANLAERSEKDKSTSTRVCAAIVGTVDLELGDRVEPVLEAHLAAGRGRFRGIRARVASDPDRSINPHGTPPGVLVADQTRRAIAAVGRQGLSLDVWVLQTQLGDALDVCKRFPDLPIIVNHVGGPLGMGPYRGRREELFKDWARNIQALGKMPNASMKLGGMAMRYLGLDFHLQPEPPSSDTLVAAWQPYFDTCVKAFGPDRCMFESNFPVDKAMCGYPVLWNAFKKLCRAYSASERSAMLADTAKRVYRIS